MARQQLQRAVSALHNELAEAEHLGDDERAALLETMRAIQHALAQDSSGNQVAPDASLHQRVMTGIERFETSHPRFADLLRSISESLSNLGV